MLPYENRSLALVWYCPPTHSRSDNEIRCSTWEHGMFFAHLVDKMAHTTYGTQGRPLCVNFNPLSLFPSLLACDDECAGVLLNDLDNVGDAILSMNLTGIFPVPHGILSNLENTTKYLQVGTEYTETETCHGEIVSGDSMNVLSVP